MYLEEITSDEYHAFIAECSQRYFFNQTDESIEADLKEGKNVIRVGLKDNHRLIAVAKISCLRLKKIFISQELHFGPIFAPHHDFFDEFLEAWCDFANRDWRVIRLRITPSPSFFGIYDKAKGSSEFSPECINIAKILIQRDFQKLDRDFNEDASVQPRFHYVKDLSNATDALSSLPAKSRRFFAKAQRLGVKVRNLDDTEISTLDRFLKKTMEKHAVGTNKIRLHIDDTHNPFGSNRILPLAYIDVPVTIEILEQMANELSAEIDKILSEAESEKRNRKLSNTEEVLAATRARISELKEIGETNREIPIAAGEFYFTPSDAVYFASGTDETFRYYNGIYAIHQAMLEKALALGCRYYNLFGIENPTKVQDGLLEFKEKFGGEIQEFLGTYEKNIHLGRLLNSLNLN